MIVILYILLVFNVCSIIVKPPCTEPAGKAQFENTPFAEGGSVEGQCVNKNQQWRC
jgi:hypothetical protein